MSEGALKWTLAGIAFWGVSGYGIWWANTKIHAALDAAHFLIGATWGAFWICVFIPLGVTCFVMASLNCLEPKENRPDPSEPRDLPKERFFKDFD